MGGYFCDECKKKVPRNESRFNCPTCKDFDLCQSCFFDEKSHSHILKEIPPKPIAKPFFEFQDVASGQILYLSDWHLAYHKKKLRKLNVKTVLTIMDLSEDDGSKESITKMRSIFVRKTDDGKEILLNNVLRDGIAYHLVDIMDVSLPSFLPANGMYALSEASLFVDEAFARADSNSPKSNNVLVHCEMGQRRSPTAVLAWLSKSLRIDSALQKIGQQYKSNGQPEWKAKYEKSRADWIRQLKTFRAERTQQMKEWRKANETAIERWFKEDDVKIVATEQNAKRKAEQSESSEDEDDENDEDDTDDDNDQASSSDNVLKKEKKPVLLKKRRRTIESSDENSE